jgi:hypothetical protein
MTSTAAIISSYEISNSQQEIMEVMIKSATANQSILWQTRAGHRTVYPVTELNLDVAQKNITLALSPNSALLSVNSPIYVKLAFRETVFKGQLVKAMPGQVLVHLPEEIHWRDFRENKRLHFRRGERHVVTRPYFAHLRADQLPSLKVSLRDISERGLGVYISHQNAEFFKVGKFIELTALGDAGLMKPLLGHVMWVRRTDTKSERDEGLDWRVGVKMLDAIPADALDVFNNGGQKTRQATEALLDSDILSPEFQDMLQVEVERTLKKMKQRPALAKYLQQLEVLRGQDSYITEHIQVLTVVCTFIARTMSWVSEASMEKFVYAAYMHDAPLFAHPRLAPLQSRTDLELHKAQLSAEEIDLFFHAPEEAAKAAQADSSAPPDVAAMLSMQKELPDGSGFPRGITQAKITPMAALFIIAHSLTDAIMEDSNWRMEEWLTKAKGRYRGGHFNKILVALDDVKITLKRR